jgi:hybrid cluster-associated redox disulfide protein
MRKPKPAMTIELDDLVGEIFDRTPAAMRVFLDFRMNCVGCPIAMFHTVSDSCREHGIDADRFLAALRTGAASV